MFNAKHLKYDNSLASIYFMVVVKCQKSTCMQLPTILIYVITCSKTFFKKPLSMNKTSNDHFDIKVFRNRIWIYMKNMKFKIKVCWNIKAKYKLS